MDHPTPDCPAHLKLLEAKETAQLRRNKSSVVMDMEHIDENE